MHNIAVVGAGVSGLSVAQMLRNRFAVTVFEQADRPGGLIKCRRVSGGLFHECGGHVFNTKNETVARWFWSRFDRDLDFALAKRNAVVSMDGYGLIPYPIENHVYMLGEEVMRAFESDICSEGNFAADSVEDFAAFLKGRFGKTLYELYFRPYNSKVWRCDLADVPLDWLQGKLPMPSAREMLNANREHLEENQFVHSSFWYPANGGSQFIADGLARGLDIRLGSPAREITVDKGGSGACFVNGQAFDGVVFCGNIKDLPAMLRGVSLPSRLEDGVRRQQSHGTTSVFCRMDANPYSWVYQPSPQHESHRIICTGNFAPSNNAPGEMTGTIEFTDAIEKDAILKQLGHMPFSPHYLTHRYNATTYPIQHADTRQLIGAVKDFLRPYNIRLVGRFAEWEYFNMDAAIASAMNLDWAKE